MKFEVPDGPFGFFNTTPLIPTKRKYDDTFYDVTWVPRKRRITIPDKVLYNDLSKMQHNCFRDELVPQYLGKRQREPFGLDDFTSALKRRTVFQEGERGARLISGRIIVPPEAGPWLLDGQTGGTSVDELTNMVGGMKLEKTWPQFSRLPPELRCLIWQHTWEHRDVTVSRRLVAFRHRIPEANPTVKSQAHARTLYYKTHLERSNNWGVTDPRYERDWFSAAKKNDFDTSTTSELEPPVSLFVNRESRHETLLHFQTAFALNGRDAKIYFNFSLDTLNLPLHHSLGMCFGINDLKKLTVITVPELFPAIPGFVPRIGPWDHTRSSMIVNARVPPVADGTVASSPEFDRAWQLLRWRFPNLREINLVPATDCKLHDSTLILKRTRPLDILRNGSPEELALHCHSCRNLQCGANRRFPLIGLDTPYLQRVFDALGLFGNPAYRPGKAVIGTVKANKKGQKDEDITVNFWRIQCAGEERRYAFALPDPGFGLAGRPNARNVAGDGEARPRNPANNGLLSYEIQCVAQSLERYLGPPTIADYLALNL
ncbi:hypothetical protein PGQ11_002229 [Apiospora arundinis]|uniref:2EXR domain-containing protein n=1 Tax=Apiospora arundinis TaxID=335852 RepID=A0ABR2JIE9_9PEZI